MALRAVPDHPKFAHLKSLLDMTKSETLGCLEAIWHFTGRFTPQGNIGKYTDAAIEGWVEWGGEPGLLISALVISGWLDPDEQHRLLVHDWQHHADKATKNAVNRSRVDFCTPTVRTEIPKEPFFDNTYRLPEPVPVPVPEPVPEPVKQTSPSGKKKRKPGSPLATEELQGNFEEFWAAYWLRVARSPAENAYVNALSRTDHQRIMEAVIAQSPGMMSRPPDKRPQGASWLNQSRWSDEVQQSFQPMSAAERLLASLP